MVPSFPSIDNKYFVTCKVVSVPLLLDLQPINNVLPPKTSALETNKL